MCKFDMTILLKCIQKIEENLKKEDLIGPLKSDSLNQLLDLILENRYKDFLYADESDLLEIALILEEEILLREKSNI